MNIFDLLVKASVDVDAPGPFSFAQLKPRPAKALPFEMNFQTRLVRTLYQDADFAASLVDHLDPNIFESRLLRWFATKILWCHKKYGAGPTRLVIVNEAKRAIKKKELTKNEIKAYASFINKLDEPTPDRSYIEEQVYSFIEEINIKLSFVEAGKLYRARKLDELKALVREMAAFEVQRGVNEVSKSLFENLPQRIARRGRKEKLGIPTGTQMDTMSKHEGLKAGQIGIVLAPTGRGKTASLVHIGASAALEGHDVLYVTCELDKDDIEDCFDARLGNIERNDLEKKPNALKRAYEEGISKVAKRIHVKYFPTGSLTVAGLRAYIKKLERVGFYPKLLCLDYADLMKPGGKGENRYADLGDLYRDIRGLGGELQLAIWTASQGNRMSLDDETEVVDIQHIADSLQKAQIADMIAALSQTPEEKRKSMRPFQIMRLYLAKNRNGYGGKEFPIKLDTARCKIWDIPPDEYEEFRQESAARKSKEAKGKPPTNSDRGRRNPDYTGNGKRRAGNPEPERRAA